MAREIPLDILLSVINKASPEFQKANADAIKMAKGMGDAQTDANKTVEESSKKTTEEITKNNKKAESSLEKLNTSVRKFRSQMLVFAFLIGTVTLAISEFAKTNERARTSLDEMALAGKNLLSRFGELLTKVSPLYNLFSILAPVINDVFGDKAVNDIERAKNAIRDFNQGLGELTANFQTGQISASEFYRAYAESQNEPIAQNKRLAQSLMEIADLQANMGTKGNSELTMQLQEQVGLLREYETNARLAHAGMTAFITDISKGMRTNLSTALSDMITRTKTAKEAFTALGQGMIKVIVDFMVQKVVAWLLEKTLLAGQVAASVAATTALTASSIAASKLRTAASVADGAAVAAAWSPAAVAVNIASFGAAGVAAAASAIAAGLATATAMQIPTGFGGSSGGAGGGGIGSLTGGGGFAEGTPDVPRDMFAMVHKNEMIIPATFAEGIRKGNVSLGGGGGAGGGDINITVNYPQMSRKDQVKEMARLLGFEIEKQLNYARA